MEELILTIIMAKVNEKLDEIEVLNNFPEIKQAIAEGVEGWLREKLGIEEEEA